MAKLRSIAVESSLTGTHGFQPSQNNAAGAVPRLIDLGVNQNFSALSLSSLKDLLEKLLSGNCKQKEVTKRKNVYGKVLKMKERLGKDLASYGSENEIKKNRTLKLVGCAKCNNVLNPRDVLEFLKTIFWRCNHRQYTMNWSEGIKTIASAQGILDMKEDGLVKAVSGITTMKKLKKSCWYLRRGYCQSE